jgi:hypothetical protein
MHVFSRIFNFRMITVIEYGAQKSRIIAASLHRAFRGKGLHAAGGQSCRNFARIPSQVDG